MGAKQLEHQRHRRLLTVISRQGWLVWFLQKLGLLKYLGKFRNLLGIRKSLYAPDEVVFFFGRPLLSKNDWDFRLSQFDKSSVSDPISLHAATIDIPYVMDPVVTVIASLFEAEIHIEHFLQNLRSQSIFSRIEVVIVSVRPTNQEKMMLSDFSARNQNVKLIFIEEVIGIYSAWNIAIRESSAPLITNMNADDLRHRDSLKIQVCDLMNTGSDVVYQDVYYSFTAGLDWAQIEQINIKSELPDVSLRLLAGGINPPHNAPMWKRALHDEIGYFDERYRSAGDHDFWIRAAIEKKKFVKSLLPHVSYFINPLGMSTKPNSPGRTEGLQLLHKYRRFA